MWNNQWYAGHATPGYGILAPALGSIFGPLRLGLVSCIVASACFDVLVKRQWQGPEAVLASSLFAVGTIVNLVVGRLPFALGLALGLLYWFR